MQVWPGNNQSRCH